MTNNDHKYHSNFPSRKQEKLGIIEDPQPSSTMDAFDKNRWMVKGEPWENHELHSYSI